MSDISPKPVKGGNADQQKQMKMLAVLGVVFLLVVVFMVIKPFSGGDDVSAPTPAPVTADAGAPPAVAGAPAAPAPEATPPSPPPARPSRTPFDPPR